MPSQQPYIMQINGGNVWQIEVPTEEKQDNSSLLLSFQKLETNSLREVELSRHSAHLNLIATTTAHANSDCWI